MGPMPDFNVVWKPLLVLAALGAATVVALVGYVAYQVIRGFL